MEEKSVKPFGSTMFDHIMNSKQFKNFVEAKQKSASDEIQSKTINVGPTKHAVQDSEVGYYDAKSIMQELAAAAQAEATKIADFITDNVKNTTQNTPTDFVELEIKNQEEPINGINDKTGKINQKEDLKQTEQKVVDGTDMKITVERFVKKNEETWGFNGIAGMDDLKLELKESFIRPLTFKFMAEKVKAEMDTMEFAPEKKDLYKRIYEEYEKYKVSIPTGLLFYGPPGTGKTFITKKLAEEMNCGFVKKNMGEMGSTYAHGTTKNIRSFFEQVKVAAKDEPIIVFLDEIDSLVSKRTQSADAHKAEEVSQFLQEFNSLSEIPNLIVIAATNRPDHLDSAILRSGRFDKKVYIAPPDFKAREEMFAIYIEKEGRPHSKLDYLKLAELTDGYVSADIEAICDEVSRDTSQNLIDLAGMIDIVSIEDMEKKLKKAKTGITMKVIEKVIKETTSSLKMVDMSIYDNWLKQIN